MSPQTPKKNMLRRDFLKTAGTVAGGLGLIPPSLRAQDIAAPHVRIRSFAGESLTLYQQASPIFEGAFNLFQPYFEELTGAKINFVSIPNADLAQRITLSLVAAKGEMDLAWYYGVYPLIVQNLLEPLDAYINDPVLTPPSWDFSDYLPGPLQAGRVDGKLYNLSVTANALALYYRTDKLERAGLVNAAGNATPPVSWDDVKRYGTAMDSRRDKPLLLMYAPNGTQMTTLWLSMWMAQDYTYLWNEQGKCIVNNADGVAATRLLKDLMQWASPTSITWDFPEGHAAFQLGKGALFPQWNNLGGIYNDAENSLAAGKFSMGVWPKMKIHTSDTGHWFALIAANCSNKELAWTLIREYNSHTWQKKFFLHSDVNFNPSRASVYADPEVQEAFPWIGAIRESNNLGRGQQRQTLEWEEINLVLQEELGLYVTNETDDVQQVLDLIVTRVDEICVSSGRLKL